MEVEYVLSQLQLGQESLATRTHRLEGGAPRLVVNVGANNVQWVLENLLDGVHEIVPGLPRKDRVDFYFLLEDLRRDRGQLPQPLVPPNPSLRLQTTNSVGMQRPGGRPILMDTPNRRYAASSVEAFFTQPPTFHAIGREPIHLHLDFENTPRGLYPAGTRQAHFGVQALYDVVPGAAGMQNQVVITMSRATYATIYEDLQNL